MPKVSVLMPVYKTQESHLREAIESILNQTFTDFEFLILDDCPNDTRKDIVKSYSDKRIKYSVNKANLGISQSRNKLIDMARGEYLAIFDHDDISLPDRLEKEVDYLDAHPEVGLVSGQVEFFPEKRITDYPRDDLQIKYALMQYNKIAHTAMMVRKSLLDKYGIRYEEQYSPAEDYMIVLRLIPHTMFYNIPDVLVKYRDFGGNTSHRQMNKMMHADALCKCFAYREYPYLCRMQEKIVARKTKWLRLFGLIPLLRIKALYDRRKIYLFGFIPLLVIKG